MSDEVMLVTGAANGIGRAIVDVALRDGARVVAVDVDEAALTRLQSEVSADQCWAAKVDVTREAEVERVFAEVNRAWGGATILVNNAGKNADWDPALMTSHEWDGFFALDLKAAWLCAKYGIPQMKIRRSGSIVNIASVHATLTAEGQFPYAAAKSGLLGLTRSMALDLGPHGIRVNSVSPGYTATRLVDDFLAKSGEADLRAQTEAKHALRRLGEPREVAEVVCFLASPAASFVTGAEWVVDGGLSARYA